tara:strand:- start:3 stop:1244 length:1242 start_codon:yes stop_codon:yes gene_type:complete
MADVEALNGVAAADIEAVNGVAKANIQAINGVGVVSGQTATRWVAAFDGNGSNMYIAYAAHSDRTSWTGTTVNSSTPHNLWMAYGKDGSGNPLWAVTTDSGSMEIAHDDNNDVTDGSTWTKVSSDSDGTDIEKLWTIAWGNDVWIGAGIVQGVGSGLPEIYRSTDGASWVKIDLSSVSGISTTAPIYGVASDGAGNWMLGQGAKIFASVNNGSAWAEMTSYPGTAVADVGFTNGTWVVLGAASPGNINTVTAAAFATEMGGGSAATWGEQDASISSGTTHGVDCLNIGQTGAGRTRIACGNGVVVMGHTEYTMAFDVNGTTIGIRSSTGLNKTGGQNGIVRVSGGSQTGQPIIGDTINTIATDGSGIFLVGSDDGDIAESTDNGATWTATVESFAYNGNRKFEAIRANVFLPV